MANLTAKELSAITDQLNFERMMVSKYCSAEKDCQDQTLQSACGQYAQQHRDNYQNLLNFLK